MTEDEALLKVKRDCLIVGEFITTDEEIKDYLQDALGTETEYTDEIVNQAIITMLEAILPIAATTYHRGAISITRESILKTIQEFKNKAGVGTVNLYRGDETTWEEDT